MLNENIQVAPALRKDVRAKARQLRKLLLPRVRNKIKGDFFCQSCQMMHTQARAANILFDSAGKHPGWVSDWTRWLVEMQHLNCPEAMYYRDLSIFIPQEELYAIFREAFEPLGVVVRRPHVEAHRDDGAEDYKRQFRSSGRTITLQKAGDNFCVKPRGSSKQRMWKRAEIKIQYHFQNTFTTGLTCRVDSDITATNSQAAETQEGGWKAVQGKLTFYVGKLMYEQVYPAIARVVATDAATGAHTFELDEAVELCDAKVSDSELRTMKNGGSLSGWCLEKLRSIFRRSIELPIVESRHAEIEYDCSDEHLTNQRPISICNNRPLRSSN